MGVRMMSDENGEGRGDEVILRELALSDRDTAPVYKALYERMFGEDPEEVEE